LTGVRGQREEKKTEGGSLLSRRRCLRRSPKGITTGAPWTKGAMEEGGKKRKRRGETKGSLASSKELSRQQTAGNYPDDLTRNLTQHTSGKRERLRKLA